MSQTNKWWGIKEGEASVDVLGKKKRKKQKGMTQ